MAALGGPDRASKDQAGHRRQYTRQMPKARTDVPVENMMTRNVPHDDAADAGGDALPSARTTPDTDVPTRATASRTTKITPYRGRIAVAAVGLVALVATLVTSVLALFGAVSLLLPLACIAVVAMAVAALRLLAVRGRQARVNRAFAHAMAPVREVAPERSAAMLPAPAAPRRPTTLFDAQETATRPLTAMELRTAALAVAHGSSVVDVRDAAPTTATDAVLPPAGTTAWAPVEVPRPTYVDAAKAERQAPAPLDLPEAPKPLHEDAHQGLRSRGPGRGSSGRRGGVRLRSRDGTHQPRRRPPASPSLTSRRWGQPDRAR
ncbi:hypothetical protein MN0502_23710 [Arthrobacter sp. MN05-02]|nr:hypothetical protein MN0502_23710 [Arthrobacter sp. MN05-02]